MLIERMNKNRVLITASENAIILKIRKNAHMHQRHIENTI